MATITILNPVPRARVVGDDPGPSLRSLEGATVGFRTEWIWPSYHVIVDEWRNEFEARGARVEIFTASGSLDSDHSTLDPLYEEFLADVDLAVVGLAN